MITTRTNNFLASLLVFIVGLLLTSSFYLYLTRSNQDALQTALQSNALQLSNRISRQFEVQVAALRRMAGHWQTMGKLNESLWRQDARNLLKDFGNFQAVEWADQGFVIRWIEPLAGNEAALNFNVAFNEQRLRALTDSRDAGQPNVTPVLELQQGGAGTVVYHPIGQGAEFQGFIIGVFRIEPLITSLLQEREQENFTISVFEGEKRIFGPERNHSKAPQGIAKWTPVKLDWKLVLTPKPAWASLYLNKTPLIILIAGTLTSLLMAMAAFLTLSNLRQRLHLKDTNQRLREEIASRKTAESNLSHISNHDKLTGLPNRSFFFEDLTQAILLARRTNRFIGMMIVDVDHFKKINDTLGHQHGDSIIRELSGRLLSEISGEISLARVGGDEFMLFLQDINSVDEVIFCAKQLQQCFHKSFRVSNTDIFLTASIGISLYPEGGNTAESLIKNADVALYQAKDAGRDTYHFFTTGMQAKALRRLELDSLLRDAIKLKQLSLVYQPKISLQKQGVTGAEVLVRWKHPEKGYISPSEFIPLAEETGMIRAIGQWVMENVCIQLKSWREQNFPELKIAVNISATQLQDRSLKSTILNLLNKYEVRPEQIELELTEEVFIENMKQNQILLRELTSKGFQLAIDDFGVGYSSLAYLRNFPISTLKIDRTFVAQLEANKDDRIIINAVIAMAHNLNFTVIAEGVETKEQADYLQMQKCDEAQGFYFSHPLPAAELRDFILSANKELEGLGTTTQ